MEMIPVKSTHIEAIGHEGTTLTVAFRNGGVYSYHDFPSEEFDKLLAADSVGKHFGAHVRGKYEHVKHA